MLNVDLGSALDVLANQQLLLGFFLAGAGLVFMIFGIRMSRPLVAISFGVLGFVLGSLLPASGWTQLGIGFIGAMVLGAASMLCIRVSLTILAGTWAGYAGLLVAGLFELPLGPSLGIAAIVAACTIALAIIMYLEVTAFILSFQGTILFVGGLVIFANQSPALWVHLRDMLMGNPIFGPFILASGTVIGFYLQSAEMRQHDAGLSV